jgi:Tfp pilus assembly protein PilN
MIVRPLLLDFQNNRRPPSWPNTALLAGGLVMAISLAIHSVNVFSEIDTLESTQRSLRGGSARHATDPRIESLDAQQLRSEVKDANAVLERLALPWGQLFADIESSSENHVALLAIEPDPEKRVVRITGEAKNLDTMLTYIRFLQTKKSLTSVYLQSHRIDERTAEKPVHFVLAAAWVIKP